MGGLFFFETEENRHSMKFSIRFIDSIDYKIMQSCVDKAINRFSYFSVRLCSDGLSFIFLL